MRILVTRPEPDASRTKSRLEGMGHECLTDPLLLLEPTANPRLPDGKFDGVAVTSANAVRAASNLPGLRELFSVPAFAVGARTAEAVRAAGFEKVTYSQGNAADLAQLIRERLKSGSRVLHLAGEHRAKEFSALLAPARIEAVTLVLYRMQAAGSFSDAALDELKQGKFDVVLHYSPRNAAVFVTLMQRAGLKLAGPRHVCLSQAVAAPVISAGGKAEVAKTPDENALLALL